MSPDSRSYICKCWTDEPRGGGECLKSLGKIENLYRERDPEEEILNPSSYLKHT